MKQYLKCTITNNGGTTFENPLKLSEARLLTQILKENKSVMVTISECTKAWYKATFG